MYTVVIAEKEHIDSFEEYAMYLEPFIEKSQFALCQWNVEEHGSILEQAPELESLVNQRREWRAIIICDERGLNKRNPFNIVEYREPVWDEEQGETRKAWFDRRWEAKEAACRKAVEEPLVRLVTNLCEDPVVTRRGDSLLPKEETPEETEPSESEETYTREMLETREYRRLTQLKKELRDQIRSEEPRTFEAPSEVLCIAKRHNEHMDNELESVWGNRDEREYSRFYDWNLYFDQMRYLVFDMEARGRLNYQSDYIRFLTAVCVIAAHEMPTGCMSPHRVYKLGCDANQKNLVLMLERYFAKLDATKAAILDEEEEVRQTKAEPIQDYEVQNLFCHNIMIPINLEKKFDQDDLFFRKQTGLAADCPRKNEENIWMGSYGTNRKAMKKLLKEFPRAVRRGAEEVRSHFVLQPDQTILLTDSQIEDIKEHIQTEEVAMVDTLTDGDHNLQYYYDRMEAGQRLVHREINRRMDTLPTILIGVTVLLIVLLGMVPTFLMNTGSNDRMFLLVRLASIAVACVAVAGFVCLIIHRAYMRMEFRNYNTTMGYMLSEIESDAAQFSEYLTHACNFMRSNSALTYYEEHRDRDYHKIRVFQKHIQDIERQRAETEDIFGSFLHYDGPIPAMEETPFVYDFSRATDYSYPLQAMPELTERIEFMQKGCTVDIPYGTILGMELRREELYD